MKINQFAIYRVNLASNGKAFWKQPYASVRAQKLAVVKDYYRQKTIHSIEATDTPADIYKNYREELEISDVIAINKNGVLTFYYVDPEKLVMIDHFLSTTAGAVITMETTDYKIASYKGGWNAIDYIVLDGKAYYLMEHATYGKNAQGVILDAYGKLVAEHIENGFDAAAINQIRAASTAKNQIKVDQAKRLLHCQKFYQNGEWARAKESGTESNYNMIDGQVNNQKPKKKKKRESVLKKLHKKQIEIAIRSGKPIPKYLEQEREKQ